MATSRRRKHRADRTPRPAHARAHAKAGLTAVAAAISVITVVLVAAGSLFAPSGAPATRVPRFPTKTVTATRP